MISNAGMLMGQCLRRFGYDGVVTLLRVAFSVLALDSSLFHSGIVAGAHGWLQLAFITSAPNAFVILQRLSQSFSFFISSTI